MRITRLYTPVSFAKGTQVSLTPEGANHIARVLRAQVGDPLHVFDGNGAEFAATILAIALKSVTVTIGEPVKNDAESALKISLVQGVSRGEKMDWAIQKATELGVTAIVPVVTSRSVVKVDRDQASKKQQHWRAIAINACEQCGRAVVPPIDAPIDLAAFLRKPTGPVFRCVLDPAAPHSLLETTERTIGDGLHEPKIELLIGPEGGLDENELAAAVAAGFVPVSLGPRVLRTETAAVTALAVLQGCFGDLR